VLLRLDQRVAGLVHGGADVADVAQDLSIVLDVLQRLVELGVPPRGPLFAFGRSGRVRALLAPRAYDEKTGEIYWATTEKCRLVYLPPKGQAQRWGEEPEWWRPEKPELWDAPLPDAITASTPRMVYRTARNRYAAMTAQAEQSDRTRAEILAERGPGGGAGGRVSRPAVVAI